MDEIKLQCMIRTTKAMARGDLEDAKFWRHAQEQLEIISTALSETTNEVSSNPSK